MDNDNTAIAELTVEDITKWAEHILSIAGTDLRCNVSDDEIDIAIAIVEKYKSRS